MNNSVEILENIKKIILTEEPTAKLYLYGSRARGEAKPDSDWDILILLNKDKITSEIEDAISNPLYDLEFDIGEVISPMIFSLSEWENKQVVTPFYYNVMNEGIML